MSSLESRRPILHALAAREKGFGGGSTGALGGGDEDMGDDVENSHARDPF